MLRATTSDITVNRDAPDTIESLRAERDSLRANLLEAKEIIAAIRTGTVDVVLESHGNVPRIAAFDEAAETYRLLIENIEQGAGTLSPEGIVLYANRTLADMLHVPLERLIGSYLSMYLPIEYHAGLMEWLDDRSMGNRSGAWRLDASGSNERVLHAALSPLPARSGAAYALLVTNVGLLLEKEALLRDKSRLEKEAVELTTAKAAAESANHAKSNFLSTMSHELRTPLNAIMGFTELTLMTCDIATVVNNMNYVLESSRYLLKLANDILELSKIEAGHQVILCEVFYVADIVNAVATMFNTIWLRNGLGFSLTISPAVPSMVYGDPVLLKQILVNLVGNAAKFTTMGSIKLNVCQVKGEKASTFILFEVLDTGIGIRRENLERIFEAFEQEDNSLSRPYEGTGLGLSISKKLVTIMGGEIGVESEQGKGSRFWFILPYKVATKEVKTPLEENANGILAIERVPLRILVAEDNQINQRLVKSMLQKLGHKVVVVGDGQQAVNRVVTDEYDLILMDMLMPEMDGIEATKTIRALGPPKCQIPIFALTADAMTDHRERYFKAGVNEVIPKPIDWQVLIDAINNVGRVERRSLCNDYEV